MFKKLVVFFFIVFHAFLSAQINNGFKSRKDSLQGFDYKQALSILESEKLTGDKLQKCITNQENKYLLKTYYKEIYDTTYGNKRVIGPSTQQPQAACTNVDFEQGNLNGWNCYYGDFTTPNANAGIAPNRHTIMSGAGVDPWGGFPVVFPNGNNFSLRLGNDDSGAEAESVSQTFLVTPSNTAFTYSYAVVFEDDGHTTSAQPFFKITLTDQAGNDIPCSYYFVTADAGLPGFLTSPFYKDPGFPPFIPPTPIYYRPWTSQYVDLSSYVGQNVTITFTTADCSPGAHFGYGYLDCSCAPFKIELNDTLCSGTPGVLSAPLGAESYIWNTGATTQNITINNSGVYNCTLTSYTGCSVTLLSHNIQVFDNPSAAAISNTPYCSVTTQFTDQSSPPLGYVLSEWNWDFGDGTTSNQPNPLHQYLNSGVPSATLTVKASNGCPDTAIVQLGVFSKPTASFTVTASCLNNPVVFNNNSTGTYTSLVWDFGDPASGSANQSTTLNPSYTYTANSTYTVSLILDNGGCQDTAEVAIQMYPSPVANYTNTPVCVGSNTNFSDQSSISGGGNSIASWHWDFGDPGSGANNTSTDQNPTHLYANTGLYNVTLTVTSNNNCIATSIGQATVQPSPTAAFTTGSVCENSPVSFTNQSIGGITYNWDFGDNNTSSNFSPSHNYNAVGGYIVTLTTSIGDCQSVYSTSVNVNPIPTIQFLAIPVCEGTSTNFDNTSSVSIGNITTWSWDFGNSIGTSNVEDPNYLYPSSGVYQVTLSATSDQGCSSLAVNSVTVNPIPNVTFLALPVCEGVATSFVNNSTITGGGIISDWLWDFDDASSGANNNSTDQSPTHLYSSQGIYNVTLSAISNNGCISLFVYSSTVNPLPSFTISATDTSGCATHCVQFNNFYSIASGNISNWIWDFGDGNTDNTAAPEHCYTNSGIFDISVTAISSEGCSSSFSNDAYIEVHPTPTAAFVASTYETTILSTNISFTDQSLGNPIQWLWNFGDNSAAETSQNTTHSFPEVQSTEIYQVSLIVTNDYGCSDTTVEEILILSDFTLYVPNTFTPNGDGENDIFIPVGIGMKEESYEFLIIDRWGDVVFKTNNPTIGWNGVANNGKKAAQQDTYVWKINAKDILGKRHRLIGHVNLIR